MKVGDKVWTYNHFNQLIEIEIRSIENCDRTDVVNHEFLLDECSTTKKEAKRKLLEHMYRQIEVKKQEISHLKKEIHNNLVNSKGK